MSHFTKAKLKLTNLEAAIKACRELGFTGALTEGKHTVIDYYKNKVDVVASIKVGQYDIGFTDEGTDENGVTQYSVGADWMMMGSYLPAKYRNMNTADIQNAIIQHAGLNTIQATYEAQGFDCAVENQANGDIEVTLTRGGLL